MGLFTYNAASVYCSNPNNMFDAIPQKKALFPQLPPHLNEMSFHQPFFRRATQKIRRVGGWSTC